MVAEAIETQTLTGDGNAPNLAGILNVSGVQAQAKGGDPVPDAIHKAMTKIRVGASKAEPTHVVLHPNDWEGIALLRTADGEYIWGPPSGTGPMTVHGLPVILTLGLTEGTGLVGAFSEENLYVVERESVRIEWTGSVPTTVSSVDTSTFHTSQTVFRAEARVGLAVSRPSAFCTVTGI